MMLDELRKVLEHLEWLAKENPGLDVAMIHKSHLVNMAKQVKLCIASLEDMESAAAIERDIE